uniref:Uncharacterized protein n=1 Tax=Chrysemys picta bellii TaxID=8478 RepID=A0A8C3HUN9_CHRPI
SRLGNIFSADDKHLRHSTASMEPAQLTAAVASIVSTSRIILQYVQNWLGAASKRTIVRRTWTQTFLKARDMAIGTSWQQWGRLIQCNFWKGCHSFYLRA